MHCSALDLSGCIVQIQDSVSSWFWFVQYWPYVVIIGVVILVLWVLNLAKNALGQGGEVATALGIGALIMAILDRTKFKPPSKRQK